MKNIDTYKRIGILSSLIIILIWIIYFTNTFYDESLISKKILRLLSIVNIIALFFLLNSASLIIKQFTEIKFDIYIYIFIGIKIIYIVFEYLPKISHNPEIYVLLFLSTFIILILILLKLLNFKKIKVNTTYFKVFIISYLIIIYSVNTIFHYLPVISKILFLPLDDTMSIISKIKIINIIPFILVIIFFIKPIKK